MNRCPDKRLWVLHAADELPPRRRRALEAHLETCAACRRERAAVARGLETLSRLEPAPAVRPAALERARQRLEEAAAARKASRPRILVLVHRFRWAGAAAVFVAAALLWALLPAVKPPAPHRWMDDCQVQEELAEITAGIEVLEVGDYALMYENGSLHKPAAAKPAADDEVERFLKELSDVLGVSG